MTDTQKTETPKRVLDWQNRKVKGAALSAKIIRDQDSAEVKELREQQAAYIASLPTDPTEGLKQINRILCDPRELTEKEYAPRAVLTIIHALTTAYELDGERQTNEAIFWLVGIALDGLDSLEDSCVRSRDIAHNVLNPDLKFTA